MGHRPARPYGRDPRHGKPALFQPEQVCRIEAESVGSTGIHKCTGGPHGQDIARTVQGDTATKQVTGSEREAGRRAIDQLLSQGRIVTKLNRINGEEIDRTGSRIPGCTNCHEVAGIIQRDGRTDTVATGEGQVGVGTDDITIVEARFLP